MRNPKSIYSEAGVFAKIFTRTTEIIRERPGISGTDAYFLARGEFEAKDTPLLQVKD